MSLFPLISAPDGAELTQAATGLPLAREVDWDFKTNQPVWRAGQPVYVTGARAVLVWAWNALHTQRMAYDVFTTAYGQDLADLIGRPYTDEVRQSEAARILKETLLVNPYIKAVDVPEISFNGSTLHVRLRLTTIYGEENIDGIDFAL